MDLTGVKFGKYTVVGRRSIFPDLWNCRCECGRHRNIGTDKILMMIIRKEDASCGYCRIYPDSEIIDQRQKCAVTLRGMKNRCYNQNHPAYKYYGARGITVCDEWRSSIDAFYEYVSSLEHFNEPGRSLDRIDNNKGYFPGNVRWATAKEQANNKRPRKKCMKYGEQNQRSTNQSKQQI